MQEGDYRPYQPNPGEQQALPVQRGDHASRSLPQEEKSWYDRTHEDLVRGFREYYERRVQEWPPAQRDTYVPEEIMSQELENHTRLSKEEDDRLIDAQKRNERREAREAFFIPIIRAWDALAYGRYEPGSAVEETAAHALWWHYHVYQEPIKLTDPRHVRIIDALTEVFGIPHQRGQTDIDIPEKLKVEDYFDYRFSQEYQDRVAQARAKRYGGGITR